MDAGDDRACEGCDGDGRGERERPGPAEALHDEEPHRRAHEHHALDAQVEHPGALGEQLAERRVEQRRPVRDARGDHDDEQRVVHAVSGAVAGLGGASQDGDFRHALDADPNGLQKQYFGYTGIVVATLGRYNPFAVVVVAFFIGGLQNAGNTLQGADFPSGLVGVIQGIILFSALGGELLVRYRVRVGRAAKSEAAPAAEPA